MNKLVNESQRLVAVIVVMGMLLLVAATVWGRATPSETIAYSRNNQLRLVDADGGSDRLLWAAEPGDTFRGLDWRPDGGGLAFASDVQADCSVYLSDLYTVQTDGLKLRRITNSPLCDMTADFPTGDVTVTVRNEIPDYSVFRLYVQGASGALSITIAPGATKTFTVNDVADLGGPMRQQIVVSREETRWADSAVTVNVVAETTASASGTLVLGLDTNIAADFGASQPTWSADGSAVGFAFGSGELRRIDPFPVVAERDEPLLPDAVGDLPAWSPTDDTVLYANESGIFLAEPGATGDGTLLVENTAGQRVLGLDWLPDGESFVFCQTNEDASVANLFRYDLESDDITPLTSLTSGFLRHPGVSPDGTTVAFERASSVGSTAEIWLLDLDDGTMKSLGVTGAYPDWRPQPEINLFAHFFVPVVADKFVGILPSPTPTQTPTPTPTATFTATSTDGPPTATTEATLTPETTSTAEATATTEPGLTATVTTATVTTATATTQPEFTATPSVTPANLPALKNGDFEAGPNGDWEENINGVSSPTSLIVIPQPTVSPRSGEYLVWLGGALNEIQQLSQPVTLTGDVPLYLQFYYQVASNETVCTADIAQVLVNDSVVETFELCTSKATGDWTKSTFDLGPYIGQSVTISFEGIFDEATVSSFFIDDVSFVRSP